jgi:hypothetical protein
MSDRISFDQDIVLYATPATVGAKPTVDELIECYQIHDMAEKAARLASGRSSPSWLPWRRRATAPERTACVARTAELNLSGPKTVGTRASSRR